MHITFTTIITAIILVTNIVLVSIFMSLDA